MSAQHLPGDPPARPLALLLDFDGTITHEEASAQLLARFAVGDWQALDEAYFAGEIDLYTCSVRQFSMLRCTRAEVANFVRDAVRVRAGLPDLLDLARARGWPVALVSGGLDCYITPTLGPLLERFDTVICGHTRFTATGLELTDFPGVVDGRQVGDFKRELVRRVQADGYTVVFVGDGFNDRGAAAVADQVFARRALLDHCRTVGLPYRPFTDFHDVVTALRAPPAASR